MMLRCKADCTVLETCVRTCHVEATDSFPFLQRNVTARRADYKRGGAAPNVSLRTYPGIAISGRMIGLKGLDAIGWTSWCTYLWRNERTGEIHLHDLSKCQSPCLSRRAAPWKNAIYIQASHVISLARFPLDTLTFLRCSRILT